MNDSEKDDFLIKVCDMFEQLNTTKKELKELLRDLRSALIA